MPTWVTFHDSNLTLDIDAPQINTTQVFSFIIRTTYNQGTIDALFYITVESCDIDQCEVCESTSICNTCVCGYEMNGDFTACESNSTSNITTCTNTTSTTNTTSNTNTTSTTNGTSASETETNSTGEIKETTGPQYNQTLATTTMQAMAGTGVLMGCSNSMISGASPQSAFSVVNQLQLFLMLPLMAKFMTDKVRNFILSYGFVTLSLDFIPTISFAKSQSAKNNFKDAQPNQYLEELGMESVSTLYNNYSLITVLI